MIVLRDVHKRFGNQVVLDGVDLDVQEGETLALLGPSGTGKSVLLKHIIGLIRPDSGAVYVLGHRITPGTDVLGRVGALVEGPGFLPHLTGRQNLQAYWRATGRPSAEAGFEEALDVAALGGALDRPVRTYSHGMRQRLGIAQAMLGKPDVLFLDEPTNGLDPPQIAAMRRPAAVEPVKLTFRGVGCPVIIAPRASPPVTTLSTPGGSASLRTSTIASDDSGVYGDGLSTTVFPARRAGAIFHDDSSSG